MSDCEVLALAVGGILVYAWMLWYLVTHAGTR